MRQTIIDAQRSEIAEHHVYQSLAKRERDPHNRDVLERIGADELRHYEFWAGYTGLHPGPRKWIIWTPLLARRSTTRPASGIERSGPTPGLRCFTFSEL